MLQRSSVSTPNAGQCPIRHATHQPKSKTRPHRRQGPVTAFLSRVADNISDPILRRAVKEPVAFWGGFIAGALALNLREDPLRSWIERTAADAEAEKVRTEVPSMPTTQQSNQEQISRTYRRSSVPSNGARRA